MYSPLEINTADHVDVSRSSIQDPRVMMAERLPLWLQPFLTWLTAKPAPGEIPKEQTRTAYAWKACLWTFGGCGVSAAALHIFTPSQLFFWVLLTAGLTGTSCGLGLFQVVVFHHCAHGTVFQNRNINKYIGRSISSILLFKHFDLYQKGHMLHHSANKLFTLEDEFTDFVLGTCGLAPSLSKQVLWRKILLDLVSPVFHARFLFRRVKVALASHDACHNVIGIAVWGSLIGVCWATGLLATLLIAWIFPVTILLQIATVFRILCEHRFPAAEVIERRGKEFVCLATAAVFPGSLPPAEAALSIKGSISWLGWWVNMLTVQLFVRLFVLVGDAPCHDFHHRRPATKRWSNYIHARQADADAGCPGFPANYIETWGLFQAIDENLESMSRLPETALII